MKKLFALRDPTLNAFLYAEIGTEDNGCGVTILSVLARLGKDPWAEAAQWSNTPKDIAINALKQSIDEMHLRQYADGTAHSTARHLISLLPSGLQTPESRRSTGLKTAAPVVPAGVMTIVSWALLYLALSIGMSFGPQPHAAGAVTPPPAAAPMSKAPLPPK